MLVRSNFDRTYWVVVEIVSLSEAKNGHIYLEVAEKENEILQAKVRANIWASSKKRILSEFSHSLKQDLKKGMKVLLNVSVEFHTVYGFSLTILDIDPSFSLGEIERQKQATIKRLEAEGLLDFNKQHVLPLVIQSIAIISSPKAAGFQDFMVQLQENMFKYTFKTRLFEATMQGEKAEESIIKALKEIEESHQNFDLVVLIRGGGSSLDLSCFDAYGLASQLAQSFLPVFTGIGHERDSSIADMVAHTRLKTPTAVAEYIIAHNRNFEQTMENLAETFYQSVFELMDDHSQTLRGLSQSLNYHVKNKLHKNTQKLQNQKHNYQQSVNKQLAKASFMLEKKQLNLQHSCTTHIHQNKQALKHKKDTLDIDYQNLIHKQAENQKSLKIRLSQQSLEAFKSSKQKLESMHQFIHLSNPIHILKKGFSINRVNGKVISSIAEAGKNAILHTELMDGTIESKIIKTKKNEQETNL